MAKKDEHPIRDGLIVTLAGAGVLYALSYVPGLFKGLWNAGWNVSKASWHFLVTSSPVPHGIEVTVAALALPTIWRILQRCFPSKPESQPPAPPVVADYTEDRFFGAVWRWDYYQREVVGLWCFCAQCDTQLVYSNAPLGDGTRFICEHCDQVVYEDENGKDNTLNRVTRQIDRKIRNGDWEQVVLARKGAPKQLPDA